MQHARRNFIDELNRKSPLAAQVGLGDLMEEIIDTINSQANDYFRVHPAYADNFITPHNALAANVASVTTNHIPVINSTVHTINSALSYLKSADFIGSASVITDVSTAAITSSTTAPLATAANTATVAVDIADTITSVSAAMTAANDCVIAQNDVLTSAVSRLNQIGNHFMSAADIYVGAVAVSAAWSSITATGTTASVTFTAVAPAPTSATTLSSGDFWTMYEAAPEPHLGAQKKLNLSLHALYPAVTSAATKANGITAFLTHEDHAKDTEAKTALGITSATIASSTAIPISAASVSTLTMTVPTIMTSIATLEERSQ